MHGKFTDCIVKVDALGSQGCNNTWKKLSQVVLEKGYIEVAVKQMREHDEVRQYIMLR